jgi:NADH-quinone oxidoreductase subunit A
MNSGLALLAFLLIAGVVAGAMLVGAAIFRVVSRRESPLKRQTYECGEVPSGPAWVRFHSRYYVVALFFVLFDVEAAFLLPWASIVREAGPTGLYAIGSFVVVLMLGWAWASRKGALRWQ